MSNAFAPIVRARPNPIFGRPVHQGSPPFDYSPILLLKPFGFRIAPDTLSSGIRRATGSRSVLAVSGFRLRARLDFSIPSCSPGQRGITPAFGYSAPHPGAEGTSTPMIHALPSAHYASTPVLHGEARNASAGSVSRIPAADIENTVVKFLKQYLAASQGKATTSAENLGDRETISEMVTGIVVHRDRLIISLKSVDADDASDSPDTRSLTIPGRSRPPEGRARSCSRIMHREATSVRSNSSAERAS
jgi:hypothetical protein